VIRTRVGYTGGTTPDPTYHRLGDHTETLEVDYDPTRVSYEQLLDVFWQEHDPCHPAYSTQYRSAVFYRTEPEREAAETSRDHRGEHCKKVHTAIEPLKTFYRAEEYHQKYYAKQGRCPYPPGDSPLA
jgi:peptide-methionine (S)-S-oxide reductase